MKTTAELTELMAEWLKRQRKVQGIIAARAEYKAHAAKVMKAFAANLKAAQADLKALALTLPPELAFQLPAPEAPEVALQDRHDAPAVKQ